MSCPHISITQEIGGLIYTPWFCTSCKAVIKDCCGNAPTIWKNPNWECSECGKPVEYEVQLQLPKSNIWGKTAAAPKCDCGASKTSNPNCHSTWCSKAGK